MRDYKCSVCGHVSKFRIIMSTSAFGSSDLDLRPPELQRGTIYHAIQECPNCKYTNYNISQPAPAGINEIIKSDEYISCNNINFQAEKAKQFFRHYLISVKTAQTERAFSDLLSAAWICDDYNDTENAKKCRELAIPLASELAINNENISLMKADILRRAGKFEDLISEYSSVQYKGENADVMNHILRFQIKKAQENDTKCYTIANAMEGK